jgi:uncharacterized damage-inducible protein DinB
MHQKGTHSMGPKDVIKIVMANNDVVLTSYLKDLSDADLLTRPAPNANHIAWQLGHLISAELNLLQSIPGAPKVALPADFDKQHSKESCGSDSGFRTKAEYLELYQKVRENSAKFLAALPDADLEKPTQGRMAQFAPSWGALLVLIANHPMMHAGQIAVLRRKLGKPIVM